MTTDARRILRNTGDLQSWHPAGLHTQTKTSLQVWVVKITVELNKQDQKGFRIAQTPTAFEFCVRLTWHSSPWNVQHAVDGLKIMGQVANGAVS